MPAPLGFGTVFAPSGVGYRFFLCSYADSRTNTGRGSQPIRFLRGIVSARSVRGNRRGPPRNRLPLPPRAMTLGWLCWSRGRKARRQAITAGAKRPASRWRPMTRNQRPDQRHHLSKTSRTSLARPATRGGGACRRSLRNQPWKLSVPIDRRIRIRGSKRAALRRIDAGAMLPRRFLCTGITIGEFTQRDLRGRNNAVLTSTSGEFELLRVGGAGAPLLARVPSAYCGIVIDALRRNRLIGHAKRGGGGGLRQQPAGGSHSQNETFHLAPLLMSKSRVRPRFKVGTGLAVTCGIRFDGPWDKGNRTVPDNAFVGLEPLDRHTLLAWLKRAGPLGIDAVIDLTARPWTLIGTPIVLGVFERCNDHATWLIIESGGWLAVRCRDGFIPSTSTSLRHVLGHIETNIRG